MKTMTLVELASYLEQTTKKHPITSLIYLEHCIDKAKNNGGLSYSCREEAGKILNELKTKANQGHRDAQVFNEVVQVVEPLIQKISA
jgi:hypothetical protein